MEPKRVLLGTKKVYPMGTAEGPFWKPVLYHTVMQAQRIIIVPMTPRSYETKIYQPLLLGELTLDKTKVRNVSCFT
jgi:hypothetical protein